MQMFLIAVNKLLEWLFSNVLAFHREDPSSMPGRNMLVLGRGGRNDVFRPLTYTLGGGGALILDRCRAFDYLQVSMPTSGTLGRLVSDGDDLGQVSSVHKIFNFLYIARER